MEVFEINGSQVIQSIKISNHAVDIGQYYNNTMP